ncbi:MAG: exonuclease domain-containing protein [Solirubrobacteraceae bacterium]
MQPVLAAREHPVMDLLDRPLRTTEFLVVDTETNGRAGDGCELTEVGAVLVGGGELHDRWEALVGVRAPLSRSIQRFTGITQAMVDGAPAAELVLGELAELLGDRVLVAHSAAFDRRVLAQAFARAGLAWPDPPALCTVALARRLAPLARQRRLPALAGALGIEVEVSHRALADAETCARVLCALLPRLCAHATTPREALELLRPARRRAARAGATDGAPDRRRGRRRSTPGPDCSALPDAPGVYVVRNAEGQALYVGKSVALRTRARAHFAPSAPPAPWRAQAATVDHEETASELGALLVEHRLIRRLRPPGNARAKHADPYVWLRCRFDVAYPVLEVAGAPAPGHAVSVGPLRGRAGAVELMEQLNSLFGLRHCGRRLKLREYPSAYGQMGRCLSPCLNDLDPNLYRARIDAALGLFSGEYGDGSALLAYVEGRMREAAEAQRYEQAAWLRRRMARLEELCAGLGALRCGAAGSRLVLAPSPEGLAVADAVWLRDGRVAGFAAGVRSAEEVEAVLRSVPRGGGSDDIAELRVVETWLATGEASVLALTGLVGEGEGEVSAFASAVLGASPLTSHRVSTC